MTLNSRPRSATRQRAVPVVSRRRTTCGRPRARRGARHRMAVARPHPSRRDSGNPPLSPLRPTRPGHRDRLPYLQRRTPAGPRPDRSRPTRVADRARVGARPERLDLPGLSSPVAAGLICPPPDTTLRRAGTNCGAPAAGANPPAWCPWPAQPTSSTSRPRPTPALAPRSGGPPRPSRNGGGSSHLRVPIEAEYARSGYRPLRDEPREPGPAGDGPSSRGSTGRA